MKRKTVIVVTACLAFFLLAGNSSAQTADTTLLISKVIMYDIAASGTQSISVPAGKVWRIESVSMGSSGTAPSVFLRNNSTQNIAFFSAPVNAASAGFPFWLPASFSGSLLNNNASYRCTVSITEYTRIP